MDSYWSCWSIRDEIDRLDDPERRRLVKQADRLGKLYEALSETYQKSRSASAIPLP